MNKPLKPPRMTRRRFFLTPVAMSLAAGVGRLCAQAQQTEEDDFVPLFNGRNLDGWHTNRRRSGHGTGGRWLVEQGVITGEQDPPGSGNGGLLLSDRKYADFELSLEMDPDWGPDSGVFFRTTEAGAGFQMYVDYHDGGNVGHLRGEMPGAFALKPFQIFAEPKGAAQPEQFSTRPDSRAEKWPRGSVRVYQSPGHARNFLDCVKSRKECVAPPDIAHRSITPGHLGYVSQAVGRPLRWNAQGERILGDDRAEALLQEVRYRKPWVLDG